MPVYTAKYEKKMLKKFEANEGIFNSNSLQSKLVTRTMSFIQQHSSMVMDERVFQLNPMRMALNHAVKKLDKSQASQAEFKQSLKTLVGLEAFLSMKNSEGKTYYEELKEAAQDPDELDAGLKLLSDGLDLGLKLGIAEPEAAEDEDAIDEPDEPELDDDAASIDEEPEPAPKKSADDERRFKASDLIRSLQQKQNVRITDPQTGNTVVDPEWITAIMAVRSLANSDRGSSKKLDSSYLTLGDVRTRMREMKADPAFRDFLRNTASNPAITEEVIRMGRNGHGGELDDACRDFIVYNRKQPVGSFMSRYRPTAQQMIEVMQRKLQDMSSAKPHSFGEKQMLLEEKKHCVASIIAARAAVGAKRGGVFHMDDKLKEKLDPDVFADKLREAKGVLRKMDEDTLNTLFEKALEGHGGKMKETFTESAEAIRKKEPGSPSIQL